MRAFTITIGSGANVFTREPYGDTIQDCLPYPEGPTYTTIMELGHQNHNRDGFLGA